MLEDGAGWLEWKFLQPLHHKIRDRGDAQIMFNNLCITWQINVKVGDGDCVQLICPPLTSWPYTNKNNRKITHTILSQKVTYISGWNIPLFVWAKYQYFVRPSSTAPGKPYKYFLHTNEASPGWLTFSFQGGSVFFSKLARFSFQGGLPFLLQSCNSEGCNTNITKTKHDITPKTAPSLVVQFSHTKFHSQIHRSLIVLTIANYERV